VTCSHHTTSDVIKENIERNLETKRIEFVNNKDEFNKTMSTNEMEKRSDSKKLRPLGSANSKLLVYLEDLHLTWIDNYKDQPALEALRDYLISKTWFSVRKRGIRQIEDVNFITCLDSNMENKQQISYRLMNKFFLYGIESPSDQKQTSIYKAIIELHGGTWPSQIQSHLWKVSQSI